MWNYLQFHILQSRPEQDAEGKMVKIVTSMALFALCSSVAWASSPYPGRNARPDEDSKTKEEFNKAAQTLQEMISSNQIPKELLDQAQCIGVIPKMTKGGFIAGGQHGSGVVSCRTGQGWSAPAFFSISGGSVGLQAGLENSEIVMLFNEQGKQSLMNGNFQLGAEAVAAGPTSGASGSVGWKAPVLTYAKSKGAYAGLNL